MWKPAALAVSAVIVGAALAPVAHADIAGDCQINLYNGQVDCTSQNLGPDWDVDPGSYMPTGNDQDSWDWVKTHCTKDTPCYNGQIPSYSNPDCWPGAIWCPGNDGES